MPDVASPEFALLVLENGLRVQLRHDPRLKRAAAALRVAAGSHDVDPAWPGLAHFLEHLFFLGTTRYSGDHALMPFVQRHGGQLNASTRERTTDYFFELPVESFPGALERLCEMLAHPRLDRDDQLREREVLHAEFIAWSRDPQARHQQWLTAPLSATHPLRAFHAGNRYSLPVPREAFQHSLQAFYQRFYQAGQITLSLAGPQALEELRGLAERAGSLLHAGTASPRQPSPPLLDQPCAAMEVADPSRLNLVFACQEVPGDSCAAVDFLATWIASAQPGGLLADVQRRGLVETLSLAPLYDFDGQVVLNIEFKLTAAGQSARGLVCELCLDWLEFFQSHDDWQSLRDEYQLLRQRRQLVSTALDLARQDIQHFSLDGDTRIGHDAVQALRVILGQLRADTVLHGPLVHVGLGSDVKWRLPQRNRFLRPSRRPAQPMPTPACLDIVSTAQPPSHEGCLYLRWRVKSAQRASFWRMLDHNLVKLREEASQAGVQMTFSSLGDDWQLRLCGVQEPMPALVEQALENLTQPSPEVWRQVGQLSPPAPLIPIRELLKRLPEHSLGYYQPPLRGRDEHLQPPLLQRLWSESRWDGLALGLSPAVSQALSVALLRMPGHADARLCQPPLPLHGRTWSQVTTDSSEQALLLFCPAAGEQIIDQAAWQLLAQLCQSPFYQRMRVELQLGYAVFSGFRQVAGRPGLLFGVQSPSTPLAQILEHIQAFLNTLPALIRAQSGSAFSNQCRDLAARTSLTDMELSQAAESLWQARLGGHSSDFIDQLRKAFGRLRSDALHQAASQLLEAQAGWLCLANGPAVDESWQVAQ
ncbi:pqqF protein [Pseudomonas sp. M47T1]|uniref:pyrroloquinoline quinone biosynthesis protein PqqF n=1 Tax=unclassified Pseudomonas TaxID=196821 RepID=UPI0002606ADE|nr:pyrroloquinoline quinone biosynthesis protein PqqF [Pseudomonas sp. M47T1]EIK98690.1 pqqF protein [Pseudomonas sp. M47T1]